MLNCVDVQFEARFNQPDLRILQELEDVLVTDEVSEIVGQYPELNINSLKTKLSLFRSKYKIQSATDVADLMREMPVEIKGLFDQIETHLKAFGSHPCITVRGRTKFQDSEET